MFVKSSSNQCVNYSGTTSHNLIRLVHNQLGGIT